MARSKCQNNTRKDDQFQPTHVELLGINFLVFISILSKSSRNKPSYVLITLCINPLNFFYMRVIVILLFYLQQLSKKNPIQLLSCSFLRLNTVIIVNGIDLQFNSVSVFMYCSVVLCCERDFGISCPFNNRLQLFSFFLFFMSS